MKYIDVYSGSPIYQSILLNGVHIRYGAEKDWLSWEKIRNLTTFKDKTLLDVGAFNGYFSIQAGREGCKTVTCYDVDTRASKICTLLLHINDVPGFAKITDITESNSIEGKYDLLFALNMLHHIHKNMGQDVYIKTIRSLFAAAKELIFEVNEFEIPLISNVASESSHSLIKQIKSHRNTMYGQRHILYFSK